MGEATKLGTWILAVALLFALTGDYLLRGVPWGLNVTLVVVLIVTLVFYPVWRRRVPKPDGGRRVLVFAFFAVALAVCVSLRASAVLIGLNILGALSALVLMVAAWRWETGPRGISEAVIRTSTVGVFTLCGPIPVFVREISWGEVAPEGWHSTAISALRGILIATPLLLVFGGLLVAADAVFEQTITSIFDFDLADLVGHFALITALFWLVCGYLYISLVSGGPRNLEVPRPRWLSLGLLEMLVILGSLNVLFASFVVVQAGYLFGVQPQATADLTYAEYARRGFFELVAVAALVIPLLLAAHWLLRPEGRERTVFRLLAGAMVTLVFVMMASALWRMYLYYDEFGLTELRLYTTGFMVWLAVVLTFYLVFVLRERRDLFTGWTIISGLTAILIINILNPDAVIAASNLERFDDGRSLDARYLTELSEDAAPVVFASLPTTGERKLSGEDDLFGDVEEGNRAAETLEEAALERWSAESDSDWRSWNLSRVRAGALAAEIFDQNEP